MSDTHPSTRVLDAITRARAGEPAEPGQVEALVADYLAGRVPDYQMSAWLATVACRGLGSTDTVALTRAYVADGRSLDLGGVPRPVLDKHSTGGVGDKTSLVVVPVVAACGWRVAKMSGRGLGHAGGTVDKLESLPGLRLDLSADDVRRFLLEVGMVITGQSADLAPGDRATYALRDVTATVESIPLIAASIVSKKAAVGADGLLLDVKTGAGALTPDPRDAVDLARTMVDIATGFGLRCRAAITDMSQPLGYAVGNALEVREAVAALHGEHVPGLTPLCRILARMMVQLADPTLDDEAAGAQVDHAIASGAAYDIFRRWARAQGADTRCLDDPDRLPTAPHRTTVTATESGWITGVDPRAVGTAALHVGAGRLLRDATIDHGAGVVLHRRVGDRVTAGSPLAELHHTKGDPDTALALVRSAFAVGAERPEDAPIVHRIVEAGAA
ncbi:MULTISPECIES: thymidine phosphorylase [unclassified Micromonospora]|uniref:thymidine phosphorylase n=1 Tax=unclassified Micromonospora TaxID=2617518 RepID=UPI00098D316F|nr:MULTISPECIES: thymidine phosphorylase [unclassified Micromonospora]OON32459.1 thymidine phosphorylase [Micromonospora sp. Rc5]